MLRKDEISPKAKTVEAPQHESKSTPKSLEQALIEAFSKLKRETGPDGSKRILVENDEDRLNVKEFNRILTALKSQQSKNQSKLRVGFWGKSIAALGSLDSMYHYGSGIANAVSGAGMGLLHGTVLERTIPNLGFWGRAGATAGALGSVLKMGLGFESAIVGTEAGIAYGMIMDNLGVWGNIGLGVGLMASLITGGFALEAVILGSLYGAAAGSVADTALMLKETCSKRRP